MNPAFIALGILFLLTASRTPASASLPAMTMAVVRAFAASELEEPAADPKSVRQTSVTIDGVVFVVRRAGDGVTIEMDGQGVVFRSKAQHGFSRSLHPPWNPTGVLSLAQAGQADVSAVPQLISFESYAVRETIPSFRDFVLCDTHERKK